MWSRVQRLYWTYAYLWRTHAPLWLIMQRRAAHGRLVEAERSLDEATLRESNTLWAESMKNRTFDVDWFTTHVPSWVALLGQLGIHEGARPRCLEIGSWQGMSALFLLTHLKDSVVTCVDTWEGSPEHSGEGAFDGVVLDLIERRFDENVNEFASRVTKFKGPSIEFFAQCQPDVQFDLIYVDGSHHSDDVLCDAILAFKHLAHGGVMIFDDYVWRYFEHEVQNPAAAIHAFLRLKRSELTVIAVGQQMFVQKL